MNLGIEFETRVLAFIVYLANKVITVIFELDFITVDFTRN